MEYHLIMCRSLTYAQRAVYLLERKGMTVNLLKVPQSVSETGCNYGVRVPSRYVHLSLDILKKNHVIYGKIFRYERDGSLEEVNL